MSRSLVRSLLVVTALLAAAPRSVGAATSCNGGAAPTLKYYGGPIIQNPKIVAVFWSSNVPSAITTQMPLFYSQIVESSFFDWLSEYNTVGLNGQDGQPGSNQGISHGAFAGGYTLNPSRCAGTAACTVSDAQIQDELTAQIDAGNLPAPRSGCDGQNQTIYAIHFPANVTITYPGGSSCSTFCGYHGGGMYKGMAIAYTVNADVTTGACAGGCGSSVSPISNQTAVASEELFNAITDPGISTSISTPGRPLAWYAENCGEVGSICDAQQATIMMGSTTWTVTKVWSNVARDCITTRSPLPAICTGAGTPAGCRPCTCADDGQGILGVIGCSGETNRCDITMGSATYGQCVAPPTGAGGNGAGGFSGGGGAGGSGGGAGGGAGGSAGGSAGASGGGAGGSAGGSAGSSGGATGGTGGAGGSGTGAAGAGGAAAGTGGAGGKPDGTEGGACYANSTCNTGLTCLSHLCVMAPKSGGGCGCAYGGSRDASALAGLALAFGALRSRRRGRRR